MRPPRRRTLIGSAGDWISEADAIDQFGSTDFDEAIVRFGFVEVEILPVGHKIRLNPDTVTPAAEAALYFHLTETASPRVLASFVEAGEFVSVMCGSSLQAVAEVDRRVRWHRARRANRFRNRARELSSLEAFPALARLLALHRMGSANIDPACWEEGVMSALKDRFLLAEYSVQHDKVYLRAIGHGFSAFDSAWTSKSQGLEIDEQPDVQYGEWLQTCYRDVVKGNEPTTDDVEAVIFSRRFGYRRYAYRRLMLPFRKRGKQLILSASVPDRSISLGGNQTFEAT